MLQDIMDYKILNSTLNAVLKMILNLNTVTLRLNVIVQTTFFFVTFSIT